MDGWKDELTRRIRIPRWKYHAGHAATAASVAFVGLLFGLPLFWACALGALGWPAFHEGYEIYKHKSVSKWRDHVADFIQHQPVWLLYFLREGRLLSMVAAGVAIGLAYLCTLIWSEP